MTFEEVTDDDRIKYFAQYTSVSLGQVKKLYLDWVKLKGAMSPECQELNRLFSQCVDGNRIKIPDKLKDPPSADQAKSPFVLDVLHDAATKAIEARSLESGCFEDYSFDAMQLLLSREQHSMSEFELVKLVFRWCRKNRHEIADFMTFFDFGLLSDEERAWVLGQIPPSKGYPSLVLNGLLQSKMLDPVDLHSFRLDHPNLRWRCVFDSAVNRMGALLNHMSRTLELFHRKFIVLRVDKRLTLAIYVPTKIERHSECQVDSTVRVFALPQPPGTEATRCRVVPTKVNYRLFCDGSTFQLYENKRANTWIFLTHGPTDDSSYRNINSRGDRRRQKQVTVESGVNVECRASVALNKISRDIHQHMGRVNRQGILGAVSFVVASEIYWLIICHRKFMSLATGTSTLYAPLTCGSNMWTHRKQCRYSLMRL